MYIETKTATSRSSAPQTNPAFSPTYCFHAYSYGHILQIILIDLLTGDKLCGFIWEGWTVKIGKIMLVSVCLQASVAWKKEPFNNSKYGD